MGLLPSAGREDLRRQPNSWHPCRSVRRQRYQAAAPSEPPLDTQPSNGRTAALWKACSVPADRPRRTSLPGLGQAKILRAQAQAAGLECGTLLPQVKAGVW